MGIVLQAKCIGIVNKGGGRPTKTVREIVDGSTKSVHKESVQKVPGSDYAIFICPKCNHRNRQSMYEVLGNAGGALSFKCKMCRIEIEVSTPTESKLILDPNSPTLKSGLVGSDGKPI